MLRARVLRARAGRCWREVEEAARSVERSAAFVYTFVLGYALGRIVGTVYNWLAFPKRVK